MKKMFKVLCCIVMALSLVFGSLSVCATSDTYIDVDTSILVSLVEGESKSFTFTPSETAVYRFYSQGESDPYVMLLDVDGNIIAENDDNNIDCNFDLFYLLEKDQTYILYCEMYFADESGTFYLTLEKTDIESVVFNDVTVYQGIDSETVEYVLVEVTPEAQTSYFVEEYCYSATFAVTLTNGDVLYSDEGGMLEYDGGIVFSYVYDDQNYNNEWGLGDHIATAEVFGFSQEITVTVKENPVQSVEFNNVTIYEDWDCLVLDEDWEDILGTEIETPIKFYYYIPNYSVMFKDGTIINSDELGQIEYNGKLFEVDDLQDDQDLYNQWGVGEYTASATIFGFTDTFTVTVMPNPFQSIKFEDLTIDKVLNCYTDYEFNPVTGEYDLEWKHYLYIPVYAITLKDGTVLNSDENGLVEFNNMPYLIFKLDDGQSYDTPWNSGVHTVTATVFGDEYQFNVTLNAPDSTPGDINCDESINNKDLGLLMQYLNNWDVEIDTLAADVNGDSSVNNKDYGLLMQYLNNWDVDLVGPSAKPDENPDEAPDEEPDENTDVTVVDALNYTKNVIPIPAFEGYGYEEMKHRVIFPKITSETENAKAFNQKMYDTFSYAYDVLINNEERGAIYDIDYEYKIDNGVIGIFITNRHGVQAGGITWFYEPFYYDVENDKEITLDEYVAAFGFTVPELFELIKTTDEYKFAYEYAYGEISIRDCIIDDTGLYVRFNDSGTMDGWSDLEIPDFLNKI